MVAASEEVAAAEGIGEGTEKRGVVGTTKISEMRWALVCVCIY